MVQLESVINPKRPEGENPVLLVSSFVDKLKDHQVDGIRFIWENIAGSIKYLKRPHSDMVGIIISYFLRTDFEFLLVFFFRLRSVVY